MYSLTPLVVMGSEPGFLTWNSPWFTTESGFAEDMFVVISVVEILQSFWV